MLSMKWVFLWQCCFPCSGIRYNRLWYSNIASPSLSVKSFATTSIINRLRITSSYLLYHAFSKYDIFFHFLEVHLAINGYFYEMYAAIYVPIILKICKYSLAKFNGERAMMKLNFLMIFPSIFSGSFRA